MHKRSATTKNAAYPTAAARRDRRTPGSTALAVARVDGLPSYSGEAYRSASGGVLGRLAGVFNTLLAWQKRAQQRYHLMTLDDRFLKDIGITRAQAEAEFRKPFWRE